MTLCAFSRDHQLEFQTCISCCPLDTPTWTLTTISDPQIPSELGFPPANLYFRLQSISVNRTAFRQMTAKMWTVFDPSHPLNPTSQPLSLPPTCLLNLSPSLCLHCHDPGASHPCGPAFLKNPPALPRFSLIFDYCLLHAAARMILLKCKSGRVSPLLRMP